MSFDWNLYLVLAEHLAGTKLSEVSDEGRFRASISRAYYACFCKSRNYMERMTGSKCPREKAHAFVQRSYDDEYNKDQTVSEYREIADKLRTMNRERCRADYDNEYSDVSKQVTFFVSEARDVFSALKRLKSAAKSR